MTADKSKHSSKWVHEDQKTLSSVTDFNLLVKLLSYEGARHWDTLAEQESRNVTLTQYIIRIPFVVSSERHENWPMACVFWLKWKQSSERNEKSAISPLAVFLFGTVASTRKGWPTTAKLSLELYWLLFAWNSAFYLVTRIGSSLWKLTCLTPTCFHLL